VEKLISTLEVESRLKRVNRKKSEKLVVFDIIYEASKSHLQIF
jgi:hypothetical protein